MSLRSTLGCDVVVRAVTREGESSCDCVSLRQLLSCNMLLVLVYLAALSPLAAAGNNTRFIRSAAILRLFTNDGCGPSVKLS